jgi:dihydrofolate reductase
MRKVSVFNFVTLNGFYKGMDGDISWHQHGGGADELAFAKESTGAGNTLLFGRVTYEMMARAWQSPEAIKNMPEMAEGMNKSEKVVFSMTLQMADWNNSKLIKGNLAGEVRKMKQEKGKDMTILGSGSIVTQLAEEGLIDEYLFMMDPLALGSGTSLFQGMRKTLSLELISSRAFKSGRLLLSYRPAGSVKPAGPANPAGPAGPAGAARK